MKCSSSSTLENCCNGWVSACAAASSMAGAVGTTALVLAALAALVVLVVSVITVAPNWGIKQWAQASGQHHCAPTPHCAPKPCCQTRPQTAAAQSRPWHRCKGRCPCGCRRGTASNAPGRNAPPGEFLARPVYPPLASWAGAAPSYTAHRPGLGAATGTKPRWQRQTPGAALGAAGHRTASLGTSHPCAQRQSSQRHGHPQRRGSPAALSWL